MRSLDFIHCRLHDTEVQNEETPFVRERKQKITLSRFFSDQIYIQIDDAFCVSRFESKLFIAFDCIGHFVLLEELSFRR